MDQQHHIEQQQRPEQAKRPLQLQEQQPEQDSAITTPSSPAAEAADRATTALSPGRIQPIDESSRRRIVAGQAVFDLASAVKELVDNSLDANSTSINIRLFNQGLDIVEVSDDGCGVPVESRPLLATPHATSKIQSFEDIYRQRHSSQTISTPPSFGFRGEALFCLANLSSNLVIATRTVNEPLAQKMEFRRDGSVRPDSVMWVPKKVGTTVAVVRLLDAVPVRRYDLKRRIGEQRRKLIRLMTGYAMFAPHVRFQLMDIGGATNANPSSAGASKSNSAASSTSREQFLLATPGLGRNRLPETIASVFGSAFWSSLIEFRVDLTSLITGSTGTDATSADKENKHNDSNEQDETEQNSVSCNVEVHKESCRSSVEAESATNKATRTIDSSKATTSDDYVQDDNMDDENDSDDDDDSDEEDGDSAVEPLWEVRGYISRFPNANRLINTTGRGSGGGGTSSKDRIRDEQLYAINQRPVDMPRLTRMFSDVWRSLGGPSQSRRRQQHPSCILEFVLPNDSYDVNVSPDKREVILQKESEILDLLQQRIQQLWSSQMDGQFNSAPTVTTKVNTTPVPHFDDDDEDEIESPNAKFNRRYAFSHDVRNIRLQHEYDDGRIRSTDDPNWHLHVSNMKQTSSTSSEESDDEPNNTLISTTPKQSESTTTASANDPATNDLEQNDNDNNAQEPAGRLSSSIVTPGDSILKQLKDVEEQGEIDIPQKRKFGATSTSTVNRRMDGADDRLWKAAKRRYHESSMAEETRVMATGNPFSRFSKFRAGASSTGNARGRRPSVVSSSAPNTQQPNNTLEQFGFRSQSNVANIPSEKSLNPASALSTQQARGSTSPRQRSGNSIDTEGQYKRVSFDSAPMLESEINRPESPTADDADQNLSVVVLEPRSGTCNNSNNNASQEKSAQCSMSKNTKISLDDSSGSRRNVGDNSIVWPEFSDMNAVMAAARKERLAMHDRRISMLSTDTGHSAEDLPGIEENNHVGRISLQKEAFTKMEVIGQFNRGFILAKSPENHLWIMDQHACDEKYNFEKLVADTVIHEQPLIAPMSLELSIAEEACVLDNLDIFEKNGFRFRYDETKPPRMRLSLTAIPHSGARDGRKAVQFGKDDVSALCSILGADDGGAGTSSFSYGATDNGGTGADGSGQYGNNAVRRYARSQSSDGADRVIARLPKAVAMFASRACRGSIMIGKALSPSEMERVVKHMAEIDHPWNCPHGRPTMRHAADLRSLMAEDERADTARLAGPTVTVMSQEMQADESVEFSQN